MPGGFHPFHAGHASLYQDAVKAFPGADVYVTASNDTSERSFPFAIKEKLARVAGVPAGHFVQVTSPFSSEEITSRYDPDDTILIFVKSEKNSKNGSDPEGPFPAEVDPTTGKLPLVKRGKRKGLPVSDTLKYYAGNEKNLQPMSRNRYIAYLPTVPFGPGIKSGSEFRSLWDKFTKVLLNPKSTPEQKEKAQTLKTEFVKNMYPATQGNDRLAVKVVNYIDKGMSSPLTNKSDLAEGSLNEFVPPSNDGGDDGGGDSRSRRIRKLLEIAIQVAKEKNIDELGMIHGMNMIAGDDFFNTAVEGILPDITDKEYMFVLQSAYKTVKQGLAEGDVVPFKQPSKALTWKQVPKDVLLLANDWLWAEYDNTGLDAVMDPKGFGNGTANELQYITAKLQQKGWTIDHNDENDGPGEFNLRLTNNRGQTVLLSIEDAQTFTGWAKGTSQYDLEEAEKTARVFHPQYVDVYFLDGPRRTPILVNRKVPYNLIDRYLEVAIKKYNLQQGRFEFRNAEEDPVKVTESVDYLEEK